MASEKWDCKREYRDLYLPKEKPALVLVPPMNFMMADGAGEPQGEEYQEAVQALYSLAFTIKMSKMSGRQPEGYFEYVVPPLEGLWWSREGKIDRFRREKWLWTSMIRQPEFVTPEVFYWAVEECRLKKPDVNVSKVRFETFSEGLCVQIMHVGPYSGENESMEKLHGFIVENGLREVTGSVRKHHEIYLSDPNRTDPAKLKTVLRLPVER